MAARVAEDAEMALETALPDSSAVRQEDVTIDVRTWLKEPTIRQFLLGFRQVAWPMVIRDTFLIGIHHQISQSRSAESLKANAVGVPASLSPTAIAEMSQTVQEELVTERKSSSMSDGSLSTPTSESDTAQPGHLERELSKATGSEVPAPEGHQRRQWLAPPPGSIDAAVSGKVFSPSSRSVATHEPRSDSPAYVQAAPVDPSPSVSDATFLRPPPGLSTPRNSRRRPPGPESPWRLPDPSVRSTVGSAAVAAGQRLPHMAPGTAWPPTSPSWPPASPRAVLRVVEDFMNSWIAEVFAHSSMTESGGPGTPGLQNLQQACALWPRAEATS